MNDGNEAASRPAASQRVRNKRGQGGRLREDLIAAGQELLSRAVAESELTIRGVTRAAGVHPQAFYLHFKSLDELLFEVYTAEFHIFTQALEAAYAAAPSGLPALRAICQEYASFALAQPARYRLLMEVPGQPHPDWAPRGMPGSPALRLLADALASAAPRGTSVAPALDESSPASLGSGEVVTLLWASLHGLVTLRASRPSFPWLPIEQLVDAAVDSALAVLR